MWEKGWSITGDLPPVGEAIIAVPAGLFQEESPCL
jgi:hypothetical protein